VAWDHLRGRGRDKFQAVGPSGQLPTTSTLNYPMQGQMEFKGLNFTAWAVTMRSPAIAYYVK
jgi:hypothetical protein